MGISITESTARHPTSHWAARVIPQSLSRALGGSSTFRQVHTSCPSGQIMGLISRDRFYGSDYVIRLHGAYWHEALARHTSSYKVPSMKLLWVRIPFAR